MFSSPTAKIEFINKFITDIMPNSDMQDADWILGLMILGFICVGKRSAELFIEMKYIKSFSQDDLYEKIDMCQILAQIETGLERIMTGLENHIGEY